MASEQARAGRAFAAPAAPNRQQLLQKPVLALHRLQILRVRHTHAVGPRLQSIEGLLAAPTPPHISVVGLSDSCLGSTPMIWA
jgi:hypothetical protein